MWDAKKYPLDCIAYFKGALGKSEVVLFNSLVCGVCHEFFSKNPDFPVDQWKDKKKTIIDSCAEEFKRILEYREYHGQGKQITSKHG